MGRVQGGARAAFATPSWGPSRLSRGFRGETPRREGSGCRGRQERGGFFPLLLSQTIPGRIRRSLRRR